VCYQLGSPITKISIPTDRSIPSHHRQPYITDIFSTCGFDPYRIEARCRPTSTSYGQGASPSPHRSNQPLLVNYTQRSGSAEILGRGETAPDFGWNTRNGAYGSEWETRSRPKAGLMHLTLTGMTFDTIIGTLMVREANGSHFFQCSIVHIPLNIFGI
jgi:hypothetical protein